VHVQWLEYWQGELAKVSNMNLFEVCLAGCTKARIPRQKLVSNRTVCCLTNVEAFSLRAADLEEVTGLFARFFRSPRVQGAIRLSSSPILSLAFSFFQIFFIFPYTVIYGFV